MDMERKVRAALADARNRQAHGEKASEVERAENAADLQGRAMIQKAQSLLGESRN